MAATSAHLQCELETPHLLGDLLGAQVPESWPPGFYDRDAIVYIGSQLAAGGPDAVGQYSWYGILRATADHPAILVLSLGYFSPPDETGTVEIGYSTAPEHRRHGYTAEAVRALVENGLGRPSIKRIVAEAHEENVGSLKILAHCGFQQTGKGRDPGYHRYERVGLAVR